MNDDFEIVIIGAGIIGLTTAYEILKRHPKIRLALLEKESEVGIHQTGHNSGVIHAGVYYKPGSLKARLCLEGRDALLTYAKSRGIRHEITGKLIVATQSDEVERLHELERRAIANGLEEPQWLNSPQITAIEPIVSGEAALLIRQTGIIDYREVAACLKRDLTKMGADFRFGFELKDVRSADDGFRLRALRLQNEVRSKRIVGCAGLYSDRVARLCGFKTDAMIVPFRGEYYRLRPDCPLRFQHLIYPVPNPEFPFLGVHFTRDLDGKVECGPNAVLALRREGYKKASFNLSEFAEMLGFSGLRRLALRHRNYALRELYRSFSKREFASALAKLVPQIRPGDLGEQGSGVRAQAVMPDGTLVEDFLIESDTRSFHVLNAPSPAATASFAIAREIVDRIEATWDAF